MNARPSAAARRLRWSGIVVGAALAGAVVAAAPAQAATSSSTAATVRTLPFSGSGSADGAGTGGHGTVRANRAVAAACNDGRALSAPQWFAVGKKATGSLVATVTGSGAGTAVIDHWSGAVLACTGGTVARASRPVDVVAYFSAPTGGARFDVTIAGPSATAPSNDRLENAHPISALPFTTTADTSAADADGPALKDYEHCELSNWSPTQGNTVWYSYRATATGPAPAISVSPATGWADADTHGSWAQQAGILEVLADGGTRLVTNEDPWDCDTPVTLQQGTTYLIGLYYGWDADQDSVPVSGGPVKLSVTAR